jgi:pilus assembly protein CpaB
MARTRGCIWLVAGVIVALLAGVVAFVTLSRGAENRQAQGTTETGGPAVQVVAAAQVVPVGTLLTEEMVILKDMPVTAVPEGYLTETDQAVGKINTTELAAGEILLASRLADPDIVAADGRTALVMAEDRC